MKKQEDTSMRILRTETCNTLSGSAKITYNIGCTSDSKIYFRITNNTGGGFYSNEWIAWDAIQQALKQCPKDVPITSLFLYPLFKGKSVNTPSFLLAALKHLKLVQPLKDKKRNHELLDFKPFNDEMKAMMSSKVAANVAKKKAANKKPSSSKKKTTAVSRHKKKKVSA
jgi:hypothetical protein